MNYEIIRLTPKGTKNQLARVVPLNPMLKKMLIRFHNRNQEKGIKTLWVFLNEDLTDRIKSFRKSWLTDCTELGKPELWFHDLRRCGLRNLIRAGINEAVAMGIGGWKTHSAMKRYEVVDEDVLKNAMQKVFQLLREDGSKNGPIMEPRE